MLCAPERCIARGVVPLSPLQLNEILASIDTGAVLEPRMQRATPVAVVSDAVSIMRLQFNLFFPVAFRQMLVVRGTYFDQDTGEGQVVYSSTESVKVRVEGPSVGPLTFFWSLRGTLLTPCSKCCLPSPAHPTRSHPLQAVSRPLYTPQALCLSRWTRLLVPTPATHACAL